MPVDLWQRAREHTDELMREFALILSQPGSSDHDVPRRLTALIAELSRDYGGFGEANAQLLEQASDAGMSRVDLVYDFPPDAGPAIAHLNDLMDEADEYCRRGQHLLTLATPADQVAFRRWFLDEFVRQTQGQPPIPWPEHAAS